MGSNITVFYVAETSTMIEVIFECDSP